MKLISLFRRSDLHRHYNGSRPGSQEDFQSSGNHNEHLP